MKKRSSQGDDVFMKMLIIATESSQCFSMDYVPDTSLVGMVCEVIADDILWAVVVFINAIMRATSCLSSPPYFGRTTPSLTFIFIVCP